MKKNASSKGSVPKKAKGGKVDKRSQKSTPSKITKKHADRASIKAKPGKNDKTKPTKQAKAAKPNKKDAVKKKEKKSMANMSVEEFFKGGFALSDDEDDLDKELGALEKVEEDMSDDEAMEVEEPKKVQASEKDDDEALDSEANDESESNGESESNDDSDVDMEENLDEQVVHEESEDEDEDIDEDEEDIQEDQEDDEDDGISGKDSDDDTSGESDEEDEDNGKDSGRKIKKAVEKHKKELEELKERDPEFYKYLEKEESGLLDFDMSADEDDEDQESDKDSEQEDAEAEDAEAEGKTGEVLTLRQVEDWVEKVDASYHIKSMKQLLVAFKTASAMSDADSDKRVDFVYQINDPNVFNKVLTATMHYAPLFFNHYIVPKSKKASPKSSSRWIQQGVMVKSYLSNLLQLLQNLTDPDLLYLAVREAEKCTVYWNCFPKFVKKYIKVLLDMWSNLSSQDNLRIQSFLALRSVAVSVTRDSKGVEKTELLDLCLKNVYLAFVRNCKHTNMHTLPAINMMRNLAVELYGVNKELGYQHAFMYIRQLAVHLRSAMQLKSKESYQTVYNWQYIHCIDFWTNVLATHCQESSPLSPLIYPLVQVALGAIRLIPTAQYYPLRFHVLKCMISLIQSTRVFIPLAPYLFEIFESQEVTRKPKPSTMKPLDWEVHLKTPKPYLKGRVYQDGILDQAHDCLLNYYKTQFGQIAFPEMATPAIITLKRFVKKTKNVKQARKFHALVDKLEVKSKYMLHQRSKVDFSPVDEAQVAQFVESMREKLQ